MKNLIRCPICGKELHNKDSMYKCINNHTYDKSKSGYINLSNHSLKVQGDNDELVISRNNFLLSNNYLRLSSTINKIINKHKCNNILDLACGTGYYTNLYNCSDVYGIDLSKKAINIASKNSNNMFIIGSIFELPFFDNSFDIISLIFAPRPIEEVYRTLKLDGIFIEVSPNTNHLIELKKVLYDNIILNKEVTLIDKRFKLIESIDLNYNMILNNSLLKDLFNMTPYRYRTNKDKISQLDDIKVLDVQACFVIKVYKKVI